MSHRTLRSASLPLALIATLAFAGACHDSPTAPGSGVGGSLPLAVSPATFMLAPGAAQQFTVSRNGRGAGTVTWSVNGVAGGNASLGTVSSNGLYTAPSSAPSPNLVMIRAASSDSAYGEAPVSVLVSRPAGTWIEWEPRVVDVGSKEPVTITMYTDGSVDRVAFQPTSGNEVDLTRFGPRAFRMVLSPSALLKGYTQGTLHNLVGTLDRYAGSAFNSGDVLIANVRDATVPDVAIHSMSDAMQAGSHVVNIRYDDLYFDGDVPTSLTSQFYSAFPDVFDFLAIAPAVNTLGGQRVRVLRNTIQGIGLDQFDIATPYGSPQTLQGIVTYSDASYFDLAEHQGELGHRWANHLRNPMLQDAQTEWPLSSMAYGELGLKLPTGGDEAFPFTMTSSGNGNYVLHATTPATTYNNLELYLMGLMPADSVAPQVIFQDQTQAANLKDGMTLHGPVSTLTVNDIVATEGARVPAFGAAQTSFRIGAIVVSQGRLLTPDEMAFFDAMAARAEATSPVMYTGADGPRTITPFYLATKQKGRLVSTLP